MNKKSYLARVRLPRTPADWLEVMMNFIFFLCGMLAVGCVLLISVYMIASGMPAIRKIGLFRFLFGTDFPAVNIGNYIDFIRRLVPEEHHAAIFFDNANRVYQLGL